MRRYYAFSILAGAIHALGYPSKLIGGIPFAPLLAFIALFFILCKIQTLKKRLLATLLFCIGHNLCGYYWIGETLHVFGELPRIISYAMSLVFSLFTMFHLWAIVLLFHYTRKQSRFFTPTVIALLATVIEAYWPQQFVTYLGQNFLLFAPYLRSAPIFGIHLFSFFSYWIVFHVISVARKDIKQNFLLTSSLVIFIIFNFSSPLSKDGSKTINIRIVQASVSNQDKISSEQGDGDVYQKIIDRYQNLSISESEKSLDLIIWPETAYPFLLNTKSMRAAPKVTIPLKIQQTLSSTSAHLLTGGYDRNPKARNEEYNSTFLFSPDPSINDVYHKRKLIPFGETLPFGPLNQYLKPLAQNIAFFSKGKKWTQFKFRSAQSDQVFRFITPICYEILSPSFIREYLNQNLDTDFIINLTNDSWYGDTSEPLQHLFLAKWRALEFQKPIIRTTNNGITSVIYPDGSESIRLGHNAVAKLDVSMPISDPSSTPYQQYGFLLTFLVGLVLAFLSWFIRNYRSVLALGVYQSLRFFYR